VEVLVVNAGSSSIKLQLIGSDDRVLDEAVHEEWNGEPDPIAELAGRLDGVDAVGHRVVHGGAQLTEPTLVDDDVIDQIDGLTSLAPLHQPRALAGIRAARTAWPAVPAVACFDTAFHATMPEVARTYALPQAWRERWGLRRFGFHGLSHQYAARRAHELLGAGDLRVVSCHLGAGASLCASRNGRSVDTTMGFTPLEGLVMATRSGSVDPGLIVWLVTEAGVDASELGEALEKRSGIAGLMNGESDMREVVRRRAQGDQDAMLAFGVYVHRLVKEISSMVASIGGLDALVFTGGVGERSTDVRAETVAALSFLGLEPLPTVSNGSDGPDQVLSDSRDGPQVLLVGAREDLQIARLTRKALASAA
jgi:acetate kinase